MIVPSNDTVFQPQNNIWENYIVYSNFVKSYENGKNITRANINNIVELIFEEKNPLLRDAAVLVKYSPGGSTHLPI